MRGVPLLLLLGSSAASEPSVIHSFVSDGRLLTAVEGPEAPEQRLAGDVKLEIRSAAIRGGNYPAGAEVHSVMRSVWVSEGKFAPGDLVGCYAGKLVGNEEAEGQNEEVAVYSFTYNGTHTLDPTGPNGKVSGTDPPFATEMALVNEPGRGWVPNAGYFNSGRCTDRLGRFGVPYVATREISAGDEVTVCYGPTYDRHYHTICADTAFNAYHEAVVEGVMEAEADGVAPGEMPPLRQHPVGIWPELPLEQAKAGELLERNIYLDSGTYGVRVSDVSTKCLLVMYTSLHVEEDEPKDKKRAVGRPRKLKQTDEKKETEELAKVAQERCDLCENMTHSFFRAASRLLEEKVGGGAHAAAGAAGAAVHCEAAVIDYAQHGSAISAHHENERLGTDAFAKSWVPLRSVPSLRLFSAGDVICTGDVVEMLWLEKSNGNRVEERYSNASLVHWVNVTMASSHAIRDGLLRVANEDDDEDEDEDGNYDAGGEALIDLSDVAAASGRDEL